MEPSQSLRSCRVCLRPQADPAMVRRSAWFGAHGLRQTRTSIRY